MRKDVHSEANQDEESARHITVAAFYKFVCIEEPESLQTLLRMRCEAADIKGSILIAHEGINGTISGRESAIASFWDGLRSDARFADIDPKLSRTASHPFQRLKVKVKPEIVTFGAPCLSGRGGKRVAPEDWNDVISDPDVIVIDTRNDYEVAIGTFDNAIDPGTSKFSDFPTFVESQLASFKDRRVAMFCTGGIRCEKASAHLVALGFRDVVQLDGGILKYLERVPREQSLWRGECFVFDDRVALDHHVSPGTYKNCSCCGIPVSIAETSNLCETCSCSAEQ